ncbi:MAG: Dabb family protein [Planctomycetota bacterium]
MPQHAHVVYFQLKDASADALAAFIAECKEHLAGHDGLEHFAVGTRDLELNRPVNGKFDASLNMIFASREAHDAYQVSPRHQVFIDNNKDKWSECTVFDTTLC